jgi:uncharacterized protein YdhG (YjbR/CyaY superfamily)
VAQKSPTLSAEERAAVRARSKELKTQATLADQATAYRDAVAEMPSDERAIAERLAALIEKSAPGLHPKTMYGMPAWANADDKIVCFFQGRTKYKVRYNTFGFQPAAHLDDGDLWPTAFALNALSPAHEQTIAALVKKAAG